MDYPMYANDRADLLKDIKRARRHLAAAREYGDASIEAMVIDTIKATQDAMVDIRGQRSGRW